MLGYIIGFFVGVVTGIIMSIIALKRMEKDGAITYNESKNRYRKVSIDDCQEVRKR